MADISIAEMRIGSWLTIVKLSATRFRLDCYPRIAITLPFGLSAKASCRIAERRACRDVTHLP